MRILQVTPTYFPAVRYGGPIRSVHGLAAALVRAGHEVHVFTTTIDGSDDVDVPLDRPVIMDGVQIHYFRVPMLRRLYWSPTMDRALRDTVDGFDVVHIHSVWLWPTWAAARWAYRRQVPYLIAPRGMLMQEVLRRRSPWIKKLWLRVVERRSLSRSAAVHVTAQDESDDALKLGFRLPEICCVPNGVDAPGSIGPLDGGPFSTLPRPYALFLSRISWKKGLDRLIEAWRDVPDLHLVIVGNDDEHYIPRLDALAATAGVRDRIQFVGAANDRDKWPLYANAELFVLPSYSENFGNVVAEAMAAGCPVVLTEAVGIAPIVRSAAAGLVVEGSAMSLAAAINSLHADPEARRMHGENGRRVARSQLSWDAVAAQMAEIYQRLAAVSAGAIGAR